MTDIAVFDLDGTITHGDTFVAYMAYVLRHRPSRIPHCLALAPLAGGFALGRIGNAEAKSRLLYAIAGGSERSDIVRFTEGFRDTQLRRMLKPQALQQIAMHRDRGDMLVLATAGIDIYAKAVGELLGFDHVLATRAAWVGDRLSRGLDGPNLRGADKLAAVKRLCAILQQNSARLIAYSDHHSDLLLLRYADRGVAVDPTPRLALAIADDLAIAVERWAR
jgi:HAD superfamily hydrolase (TIGR01490 family)